MKQQQKAQNRKQQQKIQKIQNRVSNEGYNILGVVIFFLFVIGGFVAFMLSPSSTPSSSAKPSSIPPIRGG